VTKQERELMDAALAEFQQELDKLIEDAVAQTIKYVQEEDKNG
jgi:hypothetical protein